MKRIRIAICDDDSIGRGLLQESLEYLLQENNLQAEISSYCSGQELLREQNRYDILFLDIRMPKINEETNGTGKIAGGIAECSI